MPPYVPAVIYQTVQGTVVDTVVRDPFTGITPRRTVDDGIPLATARFLGGVVEKVTAQHPGTVSKQAGSEPQDGTPKGSHTAAGSGLTGSANGQQPAGSQGSLSGPFGGALPAGPNGRVATSGAAPGGSAAAPSGVPSGGYLGSVMEPGGEAATALFDRTGGVGVAPLAADATTSTAHQDSQRRRRRLS